MKVLIVSDARSIHTKRWASSLKDEGIEIVLYTINPPSDDFFEKKGIKLYCYDLFAYKEKRGIISGIDGAIAHFNALHYLKRAIRIEKPDILHAHYATSYGFLAALTGFRPFIISVWGSDVYEFPYKSALNRKVVELTLRRADRILSTSENMAEQTRKFCNRDIGITPFGVDTSVFKPQGERDYGKKEIVFGTVKTLSKKYGIDILIKAFAIVVSKMEDLNCRLEIVGKGEDRNYLEQLCEDFELSDRITFRGEITHDKLPETYAGFDIALFLSREESFGVSAVEAMACGCPVITSDADGFREVVESGTTGIIVPKNNPEAAAEAMIRLAKDPALRKRYGISARERVERMYEWKENVKRMVEEYRNIL